MGGGPNVFRRSPAEKSNAELVAALKGNFTAIEQAMGQQLTNGHESEPKLSYKSWTRKEEDKLYIPTTNFKYGLAEERDQYDITVKLFYLPGIAPSKRGQHTKEAIDLVLKELHVPSIDLLILSFPGISFDADDEDLSSDEDASPVGTSSNDCEDGETPAEDIDTMVTAWRTLEDLHDQGIIARLGVAEFGSHRLSKFLPKIRIPPSVDQINVRDCCVVPKQLILYAKQQKIELLTHNDCTNILPRGTIRELLGSGQTGAHILAGEGGEENGLHGDVEPQWVVKYTAVVKNRGVIENKGYFAAAELNEQG